MDLGHAKMSVLTSTEWNIQWKSVWISNLLMFGWVSQLFDKSDSHQLYCNECVFSKQYDLNVRNFFLVLFPTII